MEDISKNLNIIDSSFEEDIKKIVNFENKNDNILDFKTKKDNQILDKKKFNFEDSDMNEINEILKEMDKEIEININISYNEDIIKNNSKDHEKECNEILSILGKPLSNKDVRNLDTPFKPLLKPKKVSLVGKVLYNIQSEEEDNVTEYSSQNNNNILERNLTTNL